jgi:hypothetical protein
LLPITGKGPCGDTAIVLDNSSNRLARLDRVGRGPHRSMVLKFTRVRREAKVRESPRPGIRCRMLWGFRPAPDRAAATSRARAIEARILALTPPRGKRTRLRMDPTNVSPEASSPEASAWQLEFVRLIAFPAEPAHLLDQHWWRDLASGQPEDYATTQKKNTREERGSFQGTTLSLTIDTHRLEWLIQPLAEFDAVSGALPTLGPFRERIDWFVELMMAWLANSCPPLVRLAFAGKLLQAASTPQEAYRVLSVHLAGVPLEPNPNDFLFHVNRRRNSAVVPGLPLNRMSTWSKLNVGFPVVPGTSFTWPDKCYSAVQLDMNTAPEKTEILPSGPLPPLFRELASLGVEIAERGDVP